MKEQIYLIVRRVPVIVFISALVLLHACFHCEEQRVQEEYNLSDIKCCVSWNLLASDPDPDKL